MTDTSLNTFLWVNSQLKLDWKRDKWRGGKRPEEGNGLTGTGIKRLKTSMSMMQIEPESSDRVSSALNH